MCVACIATINRRGTCNRLVSCSFCHHLRTNYQETFTRTLTHTHTHMSRHTLTTCILHPFILTHYGPSPGQESLYIYRAITFRPYTLSRWNQSTPGGKDAVKASFINCEKYLTQRSSSLYMRLIFKCRCTCSLLELYGIPMAAS